MVKIFKFRMTEDTPQPEVPLLYECNPDSELTVEVLKRSKHFLVPADGVLFGEGDVPIGIFFVRSGTVTLTMLSAGRMVFCARAEAGSLLGLPSTISNKPCSMSAIASSDAEIERLSPESYWELMQSCPSLSIEVLRILSGEVRAVRQALADAQF